MGLFKNAEEKAEERRIKEEWRVREAERIAREAWLKTPAGQASTAYQNGDKLFQYVDCIEATTGVVVPMMTAYTQSSDGSIHRTSDGILGMGVTASESKSESKLVLEKIEGEGWSLIHAGYCFQELGSESRDNKTFRVLGIYIFRR